MAKTINRVKLPEEFNGPSYNNIVLSQDGTKYAAVTGDSFEVHDMPEDGRLDLGDAVLQYQPDSFVVNTADGNRISVDPTRAGSDSNIVQHGGASQSATVYGSGSTVIQVSGGAGGSQSVTTQKPFDHVVNETYEVRSEVVIAGDGDFELGFSDDDKIHVIGKARNNPRDYSSMLTVGSLEGKVLLPRSMPDLTLGVDLSHAKIRGSLAHGGDFDLKHSNADLDLYAPLKVTAKAEFGEVDITKMIAEGSGIYMPPIGESQGTLTLRSKFGDITLRYHNK